MNFKITLPLIVITLFCNAMFAQVGIGTTNPHASSSLEIYSTNTGLLIPRVALTSNTDATTINNPAEYLMVFNTATSATLTPGLVYWKDNTWKRILNSDDNGGGSGTGSGDYWSTSGNALGWGGTSNKFIGTTTYEEFNIKVNNIRIGNFHPNGGISLGRNALVDNSQHSVAIGEEADATGNQDAFAIGSYAKAATNKSFAIGYYAVTGQTSAFALGTNATSNGTNAYALGNGALTNSNATDSYAIGNIAKVSGSRSYAIGYGSETSSNDDSYAFGSSSLASGSHTFSIGNYSKATGVRSYAFGHTATSSGTSSLAIGENTVASNNNALALITGAEASGLSTIAIGFNAKASAQYAAAYGYQAQAIATNATAIGYKAVATQANSLILGNTSNNSCERTKVGIGTTTPSANLEVDGTFKYVDGTQGAGKVLVSDAAGNASWTDASNIGGGSGSGSGNANIAFAELYNAAAAVSNYQGLNANSTSKVNFGSVSFAEGIATSQNNDAFNSGSVAGTYKVSYTVTIDKHNGTAVDTEFYLAINWNTKVVGSSSFASVNSNNVKATVSVTKYVHLNANQDLYLLYNVTDYTGNANSVSDCKIVPAGTIFNIELVKAD